MSKEPRFWGGGVAYDATRLVAYGAVCHPPPTAPAHSPWKVGATSALRVLDLWICDYRAAFNKTIDTSWGVVVSFPSEFKGSFHDLPRCQIRTPSLLSHSVLAWRSWSQHGEPKLTLHGHLPPCRGKASRWHLLVLRTPISSRVLFCKQILYRVTH